MFRWAVAALAIAVIASLTSATAAQNTIDYVPRAGGFQQPILPNDLKPDECFDIYITAIVVGGNGSGANELVLGGPGGGNFQGGGGDDCIVAGGGLTLLWGQAGNDRLIAGPITFLMHGGPGSDRCYLRGRSPMVFQCEVVIP